MEDFIGHLLANWPTWLALPILIIGGIVWAWLYFTSYGSGSSSKHEWPEDKKKRLAKEKARKEQLQKMKQNLKFKKG